MTRIKITGGGDRASVEVSGHDDEMHALADAAVGLLIRGVEARGYDRCRKALEEHGNDVVAGILGGFHADGEGKEELTVVFHVLMALFDVAKRALGVEDGQEDGDEGEYRIVEGERCRSPSATGAEGSSSRRTARRCGAGAMRARARGPA
jgi:hypothetical protein